MRNISDIIGTLPARVTAMPENEYRAIPAISPSTLVKGLRGVTGGEDSDVPLFDPLAVKLAYENQGGSVTDNMRKGTLAHLFLFEPERVQSDVAIWEGATRTGKAWQEFEEINAHKLIVRKADFDEVREGMSEADKCLKEVFADHTFEQAVTGSWQDVKVKGKPDAYRIGKMAGEQRVYLRDFKTTEVGIDDRATDRVTVDQFYREKMALYRLWHSQATGIDKEAYRVQLVFVQLKPPYGINVKDISNAALDYMEKKMLLLLEQVRKCIADGFQAVRTNSSIDLMPWEEEVTYV